MNGATIQISFSSGLLQYNSQGIEKLYIRAWNYPEQQYILQIIRKVKEIRHTWCLLMFNDRPDLLSKLYMYHYIDMES